MTYSALYLSICERLNICAETARLLKDKDVETILRSTEEICRLRYEAQVVKEEEEARNFKPFGFIFDKDGEARPMTQAELEKSTHYHEDEDKEEEEDCPDDPQDEPYVDNDNPDPLADGMTFAKWSNGFETSR